MAPPSTVIHFFTQYLRSDFYVQGCKANGEAFFVCVLEEVIELGTGQESHGSSLHLRLSIMHWVYFSSHFNHRKARLSLSLECITLWFPSITVVFCKGRKNQALRKPRKKMHPQRNTIFPSLQSYLPKPCANSFPVREVIHPSILVGLGSSGYKTFKAKTTFWPIKSEPLGVRTRHWYFKNFPGDATAPAVLGTMVPGRV